MLIVHAHVPSGPTAIVASIRQPTLAPRRDAAAVTALHDAVDRIEAEARRDAAAAAWHAESIVRFLCATVGDRIAGVRVSEDQFIVITAEFPWDAATDHGQPFPERGIATRPNWRASPRPGPRRSSTRASFLAGRQRRVAPTLYAKRPEVLIERHRAHFDAILPFFLRRGRLPSVDEVPEVGDLYRTVPGLDALLEAVRVAVGPETFDALVAASREDVLIYLALAKFDGRPARRRPAPHPTYETALESARTSSAGCSLLSAVERGKAGLWHAHVLLVGAPVSREELGAPILDFHHGLLGAGAPQTSARCRSRDRTAHRERPP